MSHPFPAIFPVHIGSGFCGRPPWASSSVTRRFWIRYLLGAFPGLPLATSSRGSFFAGLLRCWQSHIMILNIMCQHKNHKEGQKKAPRDGGAKLSDRMFQAPGRFARLPCPQIFFFKKMRKSSLDFFMIKIIKCLHEHRPIQNRF